MKKKRPNWRSCKKQACEIFGTRMTNEKEIKQVEVCHTGRFTMLTNHLKDETHGFAWTIHFLR